LRPAAPGSDHGMAIILFDPTMLNPLRSEREAFRFLIYVAIFFAVLTAVVLIARTL
jgi:hypothetical protein